jgi:hypothetical protein
MTISLEKSGLRPFFQACSFVAAGKKRGFCQLPLGTASGDSGLV